MKVIYSLIIAVIIFVGAMIMTDNVDKDLQSNIIRLHIIADDDSERAQSIKLRVRDEIIKNVSLEDKDFLQKSERIANEVVRTEGYTAKSVFGKFSFPSKKYRNITLPSGEYYGIRVVLGRGTGHNWWCIMYPPMCVVNNTEMELVKKSQDILKNSLSEDSYEIITSSDNKIRIKFKTVELINRLKKYLR